MEVDADQHLAPGFRFTVRTLPLRIEPLPGEQLQSWLEALATRSGVVWADLLTAVGLKCKNNPRPDQQLTLTLTPVQLASVSFATRIDVTVLQAMTPSSWPSTHDAPTDQRQLTLPGSRFCPECLRHNGGRWPLWWRLRWAFACPTHDCLLVDMCPRCGRRQRIKPLPEGFVPTPGRCMRRALDAAGGPTPRRCNAALADTQTVNLRAGDPALQAQHEILDALARGSVSTGIYTDAPISSSQFFVDMTAIGEYLLRRCDRSLLRAHVSPAVWAAYETQSGASADALAASLPWILTHDTTTAATVAAAATLALPVLSDETIGAAAQRLQGLQSATDHRTLVIPTVVHGHNQTVSAPVRTARWSMLASTFGPIDQLRHRSWSGHPREPTQIGPRHRTVPALAWAGWAAQFASTGLGFRRLQTALSVSLLVVGSRTDLAQACSTLGSATTPRDVTRVLQVLRARSDWAVLAAALSALAEQLDDQCCPIDYARRRELPYRGLLRDAQWHRICRECGIAVGGGLKIALYRCWLYERLTGSPAPANARAVSSPRLVAALAELPRALTPDLASALDTTGRAFLDRQGLSDEPLLWSPDRALLHASANHETYWEDIDIGGVHRLIREQCLSLRAAARTLNADIGTIRAILSEHPAPGVIHKGRRGASEATAHALRMLPRATFLDLYSTQGLSLATIAKDVGVSRSTVTHLANDYGVRLRPAHRPKSINAASRSRAPGSQLP